MTSELERVFNRQTEGPRGDCEFPEPVDLALPLPACGSTTQISSKGDQENRQKESIRYRDDVLRMFRDGQITRKEAIAFLSMEMEKDTESD